MLHTRDSLYTSKIIKAGALLGDTKTLLANWDDALTVEQNLDRCLRDNELGKASRSRIADILTIFRQRYLFSEPVTRALVVLVKQRFPAEGLDRVLYFLAARSDPLLHDVVTEILVPLQAMGRTEVIRREIELTIARWAEEGKTAGRWSPYVLLRVVTGLLSTLRDFGVLQGTAKKRLAPMYLPVEAFAFIAFYLKLSQPSGERLIDDPEWRLFFLSREAVERFLMEAHQRRLLEYHAAGSIVRITYPVESIEEYAHVVANGAH